MNAAALPFSHPTAPAAPPFPHPAVPALSAAPSDAALGRKTPVPALWSLALHALLLGLALLAGPGTGGGMPGNGAGSGFGPGDRTFMCGVLTLNGAEGANDASQDSAPPVADISAAVAEPAQQATKAVAAQEMEPCPPEPPRNAVPIPARPEPKKAKNPATLVAGQKEKPAPKTPASADADQARTRREKQAKEAAPSEANAGGISGTGATTGGLAETGTGDDREAGGGGMHLGFGGSAEGAGSQGGGLLGTVDSKPRVVRRSKVTYPELARKSKITGHVLLRFHLDERGSISRLQVIKADPPGIFEDAALASVKQWRFAPAMKNGRPVPYWVELPMPFILK